MSRSHGRQAWWWLSTCHGLLLVLAAITWGGRWCNLLRWQGLLAPRVLMQRCLASRRVQ